MSVLLIDRLIFYFVFLFFAFFVPLLSFLVVLSLVLFLILLCVGKIQDHVHGSVNSQHTAVDAEVIASDISPFFAGVVIVVAGALLIGLHHDFLRFGLAHIVGLCQPLDLHLVISRDEHAYHVGIICQSVVGAPSHNHAEL